MRLDSLTVSLLSTGVLAGQQWPQCDGCLTKATPESVGLDSAPLQELEKNMSAYNEPGSGGYDGHPVQPGAAVAVGHNGKLVSLFATGHASLYADANGTKLPESQRVKAQTDTIYDLASLSKLFTTVAALREIDQGRLDYTQKVSKYLPAFATNGKENVTVLQLLTHTSGFDADPDPSLASKYYDTDEERHYAPMMASLMNAPGEVYKYSDLNFMNMQLVLEKITGRKLDELVRDYTDSLGMYDTFYNRGDLPRIAKYDRMAVQEFQIEVLGETEPQRAQPVHGTVHDENAWATSGVSGHAGVFSTVEDISILCQMVLNNGTYNSRQILKPETVDLIFHNFNTKFKGDEHGLGFELNQKIWSGPMQSLTCAGHTGFTGTTVAIDRASQTFFVLFANRVHPSREWSSNNIAREALGYWVAKSLGRNVQFPKIE